MVHPRRTVVWDLLQTADPGKQDVFELLRIQREYKGSSQVVASGWMFFISVVTVCRWQQMYFHCISSLQQKTGEQVLMMVYGMHQRTVTLMALNGQKFYSLGILELKSLCNLMKAIVTDDALFIFIIHLPSHISKQRLKIQSPSIF